MSQTKDYDFTAALADYEVKIRAYRAVAQDLRRDNKAALFKALHAAGITQVVVSFDGYGDSGQVEHIEATVDDIITSLPDDKIMLRFAVWNTPEPREETLNLRESIEAMSYDCLSETHCGWENNDGAYGEFVFRTADQTIALDFNQRYTDSEHYAHDF